MPYWSILHSDPHIFHNPHEFQYDRFVDENKAFSFANGNPVRFFLVVSFGGVEHPCPGRKVISYKVRLYVAMRMLRFELRLPEGESAPS
jgi:cytochrome P450